MSNTLTAMQELIKWVRNTFPMDLDYPRMIESKATELLDKEKEQIMDAYLEGFGRGLLADNTKPSQTDEQYYTKTYNQ